MNTHVRWLMMVVLMLSALVVAPVSAQNATVDKAVAYVRTQQQADGSFAGFGPSSTADAIYALAAAGVNVAEVKKGGKSALDYINSQPQEASKDVGTAAKFVIALLLAGQQPTLTDGTDLVQTIEKGYDSSTGQYGKDVTTHAFSLIALTAAGRQIAPEATTALTKLQLPDGGWSFDGTSATGSDTNTTSIAIQALKAMGDTSGAIGKAVTYLKSQQNSDGGFPYAQAAGGAASDANSTALTIQGLIAAGEDPAKATKDGKNPVDRLAQFQNQTGAFRYQDTPPDDNAFATYQAIPALAGETLPTEALATASVGTPSGTAGALPNTGAVNRSHELLVVTMFALLLIASGAFVVRRRA